MPYDVVVHYRRTMRLVEHDYDAVGISFLTFCTEGRSRLFGHVRDGEMRVNALGRMGEDMWVSTEWIRPDVSIDIFALMPDHLHGPLSIRASGLASAPMPSALSHR